MQTLLGEEADQIGRESGFIQRQVKLKGSSFAQAVVLGFLSNPEMRYSELGQSAASVGLNMSVQGLEQRFTPQASEFLRKLLERAVKKVIEVDSVAVPIYNRFTGVYLRDSSVITLPKELKEVWRGVGGSSGESAALKIQVSWENGEGRLCGLRLQNGRDHDQTSPYQTEPLPAGSLQLGDLGFFSLDKLEKDQAEGVWWITRWKTGTILLEEEGKRLELLPWLRAHDQPRIDCSVKLGAKHQIPCRLLAYKVPQQVAEQRRRRMKDEARKKQQPLTAERLALTNWVILLTNTAPSLVSADDALIFYRVRWQVEILFKLWKSLAKIDQWRSQNPWRILCEIYAKLIGLVIFHWLFSACIGRFPDRSLFRAAKTLQKFAIGIAAELYHLPHLLNILTTLEACLSAPGTCLEKRKAHPATFQLLLTLGQETLR